MSIHSDQGPNLTGEIIGSLCRLLGINRTQTSVYHPQQNRQVEHFNHTLEAMLAKLAKDNQRNWDLHIPKVLLAYRTSLHESTGYSPYRVNFGRSPNPPVDINLRRIPPEEEEKKEILAFVEDVSRSLKEAYTNVRQKLDEAHRKNKTTYDKGVTGTNLIVGDRVWLYIPAVGKGKNKKFSSLWCGP